MRIDKHRKSLAVAYVEKLRKELAKFRKENEELREELDWYRSGKPREVMKEQGVNG